MQDAILVITFLEMGDREKKRREIISKFWRDQKRKKVR